MRPHEHTGVVRPLVEAAYRDIFEALDEPAFLCEVPSMRIIEANTAALQKFDYSADEITGYTFAGLSSGSPPYSEADTAAWLRKATLKGPQTSQWLMKSKTGSLYWTEMHARPCTVRGHDHLLVTLRDIAGTKQAEHSAISIMKATATLSGQAFFTSVIEHLATMLRADYAFIASTDDHHRARTVAVVARSGHTASLDYELRGTPCENVIQHGLCSYTTGVKDMFPDDLVLAEWDAEAYIATRLTGSGGNPIGLMAIVYRTPVPQPEPVESLLLLFEDRVAAELEREHSRRLLAEEQSFSEAAINSVPGAFYLLDSRGQFLRWNRYLEEISGFSADEIGRMDLAAFFGPEDSDRVRHAIAQVLIAGQGTVEADLVTRGQMHIPSLLSARRMMLGYAPCIIGLAIDMTEQQGYQEALRRSELQYRSLIENIMEVVFSTNDRGIITFVSPTIERTYGYRPSDLIGKPLTVLVSAAAMPDLTEQFLHLPEGKPQTGEYLLTTATGEQRWVKVAVRPRMDEGHFQGATGTLTDIHQRKTMERALLSSEQRFRAIVECSPLGMHMYQLHEDGRLIFAGANPAADKILGVPNGQFIGRTIEEAFPSLSTTEIPERYRSVAGGGGPWETSQILYQDDRIAGAFEVHAFQTAPGRMVAAFLDITERKRAEETLQRRHAFEQLITEISTRFINLPSLEILTGMEQALGQIGTFTDVDAAYVHLFSADQSMFSCVASWVREGFPRRRTELQNVPTAPLPRWKERLARQEVLLLTSVDAIPSTEEAERQLLQSFNAKSVIEVPVVSAGTLRGVMGLATMREERKWPDDYVTLLRLIAQIFSNALDRRDIEDVLALSEERLDLALKGADLGLWDWDIRTNLMVHNDRWAQMLGYDLKDLEPRLSTWEMLVHPEDKQRVLKTLQEHLDGVTDFYEAEFRMHTKSGSWRWILDRGQVVARDEQGTPLRMAGTHLDITDRKASEEKIRSSLREKEVMLREIHHRVKNNLQVISSLLSLQSQNITDRGVLDAIRESHNRVRSMAIVHQLLYQENDFGAISLADYIHTLIRTLNRSFVVDPDRICFTVSVKDVRLGIDTAIPCGLITNELITNALKHAFPDDRRGSVSVSLARDPDDQLRLTVSDDGIGLPQGFDPANSSTLGLQLVHTLAEQIHGRVELASSGGTRVTVRFPQSPPA